MLITWDEPKRLANLDKHGLDFALVEIDFFADALVEESGAGRYKAIGMLGEITVVVVIFAPLGEEALSIISLRPANRRERILIDGQPH
jgi:uncharacterized DUF497 family protein